MRSVGRLFLATVLTVASFVILIAHYAGAGSDGIIYGILIGILVIVYFLPTYIGYCRLCPSKHAILALNLFLGWTLIGWVASLVWSLRNYKYSATNVLIQKELQDNPKSFNNEAGVSRDVTDLPSENTKELTSDTQYLATKKQILKFLLAQEHACSVEFIGRELTLSSAEVESVLATLVSNHLLQRISLADGTVVYQIKS